jgi:hypothetical protein
MNFRRSADVVFISLSIAVVIQLVSDFRRGRHVWFTGETPAGAVLCTGAAHSWLTRVARLACIGRTIIHKSVAVVVQAITDFG